MTTPNRNELSLEEYRAMFKLCGGENLDENAGNNGQGNDRKIKKKSRGKCGKNKAKSKKQKRKDKEHTDDRGESSKRQRIEEVIDISEDDLETKAIDSEDVQSKENKSSIPSTITSSGLYVFDNDDLISSTAELKPLNFNFSATIQTTYNPKPSNQTVMKNNTVSSDEHSFDESKAFLDGISSKTTRTKVFAGTKSIKLKQPASLFDHCKGVLKKSIGDLKYTGNVPFNILQPVLERATPEQLLKLEDCNPYLLEDSEVLWRLHVNRYYCTQRRHDKETWREMFLRCTEEKKYYWCKLTEKVNQQKWKPPGIIPKRKEDQSAKDKSVAPVSSDDDHVTYTTTRKRIQHSSDKAKPAATPAVPVEGGASDTTTEAKPEDARKRVIDALKNSVDGGSSTKRPKKAPLMEKSLKFLRNLRTQL